MRSLSAVALLTLAIVTESLGAHSDRSRQRSGPIRSVPVGADVKRDIDFDCPEEFGYYSHPTDCTLYYVCVFGGALLESCTGGLMYSHELQTCDWPRNVGCDGTSAVGAEELERISERDPPPPPPPRRTPPPPPPPPPRAQPNPVITSRGQPKFNREEYQKQQQLYAEVDDLPPVEEIESDRQQRVYRGQPSTIGQVQKDRDGYGSQVVSSRTLNSNIIPASITQNSGKIGSFSFGTQVDDRRTATATQAPQTYSEDKSDNVTDLPLDRQLDIETNEIDHHDVTEKPISRKKREVIQSVGLSEANSTQVDNMSDRSSNDEIMEYIEEDTEAPEDDEDESNLDDIERGKRQIRYYVQKGYKNPGKQWTNSKPIRFVDFQQYSYNPRIQNTKYQPIYNGLNNNYNQEAVRKPYSSDSNSYSTANPFSLYQSQNSQSERPFKASLPDPFSKRLPHTPMNVATQIITKSPPISALKNNENPFSALSGGYYNNQPGQSSGNNQQNQNYHQFSSQQVSPINRPAVQVTYQDSSLLPSTVVTGKPIKMVTSPQIRSKYRINPDPSTNNKELQKDLNYENQNGQRPPDNRPANQNQDYDDEEDSQEDDEEEESSEEDSNKDGDNDNDYFNKHDFPEPPYEFTHPRDTFANIQNPFADPNFNFDAFIAKLREDHYSTVGITTSTPKTNQNIAVKIINSPESTTDSNTGSQSTYDGLSTPHPFTVPTGPEGVTRPVQSSSNPQSPAEQSQKFQKLVQIPQSNHQNYGQQQQQQSHNEYIYNRQQQNAGIPLEAVRPKLKPPNFNDDRQLPINYSFNRPDSSTSRPNNFDKMKGETQHVYTVTQKPYIFLTSTGRPLIFSTPKQQYLVKPEKIISLQPHLVATGKPYLVSSIKPHNAYIAFKQSTQNPLTTLVNEQLSALQHIWKNPTTATPFLFQSTVRPSTAQNIPKLESLFALAIKSTAKTLLKNQNFNSNGAKEHISSTTKAPPKRRPIPKPSPEMNDYYYDEEEDEQYYYEPPVKSKYMPSTEVKPQRPPMAQNYQEYEDYGDSDERPEHNKPLRTPYRRPAKYNYKPDTATKNLNDVSVVTKTPPKDSNKYINGKIPVPVMVDFRNPAQNVLIRPDMSNYEVVHHGPRNRTLHFRKPTTPSGPFTLKPPKYLNHTTLRPYTVRHRLAKPTTVKEPTSQSEDNKQTRGRMRHHNIVAEMKLTTPRDSYNQETRYTKTKHDDKTNSLEPTESVSPASFSASPRPKMLYNGSQNYSPDQYDPYYAVYDEDSELYKDPDYVQQYNPVSLRPAVQQTYRGTPPPARRPVEAYTPRPSQDDYDDALIHGQINNQNQYQAPIRHSTRGEGNELGYDHIPSSVRTTIYEATSISTTPSTTSTSTTQRSTTAPFTEAMTPSRHTPRSSTDENPYRVPEPSSENPSDGTDPQFPSTTPSIINFSSLAKPFEKTDNSYRLKETITPTEVLPTSRPSRVTNNNNKIPALEVVQSTPNRGNKKVVSLTTGFSIRRNLNNSNNPYTLTVISRPFDSYNRSRNTNSFENDKNKPVSSKPYYEDKSDSKEVSIESQEDTIINTEEQLSESSMRRNDGSHEIEESIKPIHIRPSRTKTIFKPRTKIVPTPSTSSTTKYYLKSVIKRPAPFSSNNEQNEDSTENTINTEALIEAGLQNSLGNNYYNSQTNNLQQENIKSDKSEVTWNEPTISPYRTFDNLRNNYNKKLAQDYSATTASITGFTTTPTTKSYENQNFKTDELTPNKASYYSYRVLDEEIPDHTTEIFSGTVKNIIKTFFDDIVSTPKPTERYSTPRLVTTLPPEEKTVNIGFHKKTLKYVDEQPLRNNVKRVQIITEPTVSRYVSPKVDVVNFSERNNDQVKAFSLTTSTSTMPPIAFSSNPETTPVTRENINRETYQSKFNAFVTNKPEISSEPAYKNEPEEISRKFQKIIVSEEPSDRDQISINNVENEVTKLTRIDSEPTNAPNEHEWNRPTNKAVSEIATTTSTTKSTTTTTKTEPTSTTKSLSFPTRASRVNPAIKLAATTLGGGRRSYQSSSKCSSDNSLQANPKCNEIKYQRPTSTRGRGSAHYTTSSGSDTPQHTPNRGTPPTRNRPTLKPSTAVVTNPNPIVDIYASPPSRPGPVYPQPTPDKTAAKCRKDVCLLPDCSCGGKDIPGDLPVESVPQLVILTFDDSVNDLNKGLYADLFEKGRVNPNGCPISATFYVSHEWTDYSQVQNLYSAGHEMASHTISHSFGEQFSQKKWHREVGGQREILAAYGGVKLDDVRGMRAPFLSVGGNKMFKMLYDSNFTYDSSLPVYENRPPSWPYTLDYKLFHDCMIPPCPTKSYPGVWEVPMVMWQDLNGGRCSMGDACANPPEAEGVYKMLLKNFDRHYTTNRAPFGLFYHAAWFTQPHHKAGFIMFLDFINQMSDVWIVTNWQALQWVRDPTPISRINNFQPFQCNYQDRPKKCNNPKVCNLWHKSGVRYMRTCQPCPEVYPWTGKTGIKSSRIDNEIDE